MNPCRSAYGGKARRSGALRDGGEMSEGSKMADTTTLEEIEEQIHKMGPEQLTLLAQIIRSLSARNGWEAWETLLAAESSLRKDWESPEEDAAWADL